MVVCDKGLDCIHSYRLHAETGRIHEEKISYFPTSCCPRHVAFHPDGPYAYLLAEWFGGVFSCKYDEGKFFPIEWHRTTPLDYVGHRNIGAEIAVHPSGRFLYASNRGHDSLVSYSILEDGRLVPLEWCTAHVAKPRFFSISADGRTLYCANEQTHCVSSYSVDLKTGQLKYLCGTMAASAPACISFSN